MIRPFKKGESLTARKLNKLTDAVRAAAPNEGVGIGVVKGGSGGWSLVNKRPHKIDLGQPSGVSTHPWKVSLSSDNSIYTAKINEGLIFDSLLSITKITPTLTEDEVVHDDLVCLEYTYDDQTIKSIIVPSSVFEPYTESQGEILTVTQPLARINVDGDKWTVEQMARNNFEQVEACKDGDIIKVLKCQ